MRLRRVLGWTALAIPLALFLFVFVAYWMSDNVCGDPGLGTPADPVKAIIHCDYGTADVLELRDVEKPVPRDDQILVKVRAAAVNPLDWHFLRGTPYVLRLDAGLRRPENIRLGVDFAGTVEAVGANVTRLEPGNDVFGGEFGAFGEYVAVHQDWAIVKKPADVSFEQAASAPMAAVTALQALRDRGKVQRGERVLINGASGGVGTFAVQLARHFGAHVTGVCSTRNLEMVRLLGADEVISPYLVEQLRTGIDPAWVSREVRQEIERALALGEQPAMARLSRGLEMSERTLRRALDAERLRFSELVDGARRARAGRALRRTR